VAAWGVARVAVGVSVLTLLLASSAPAAPTASSNLLVNVTVGTEPAAPIIQRGGTTTVNLLSFRAGISIQTIGPDPAPDVRGRFELPAGLHWGVDLPDPSEGCTGTASTASCLFGEPLVPNDMREGWFWDVVADVPGTYVLRAEGEASVPDPDTSDNASTVTVIVRARAAATAVRVAPSKPKAGSVVAASVGVTAGGKPVEPTAVSCAGRIAGSRVAGTPRAGSGKATCRYRTPKSAKGKILRGTIAFQANDERISRRFAVKLR
jgi:hypothetical protein